MAKKQNQNDLGAIMAAQNEISGLQNARLQNSQAEQAFLQQQAATNGVMMQAAQLGTQPSVGQQVGAMNPQTQAILAQYGITGTPTPGSTSTTSRTTQAGPNIKIENKTTNNHEVKVINTGGGGGNSDAGNQAKFQTWLSNSFAKQQGEYEVQRRAFARRDRDLEKQSNRLMRQLESGTKSLSEKLSPENWTKPLGSQFKTTMILFMTMLLPKLIEPLGAISNKVEEAVRGIVDKINVKISIGSDLEKAGSKLLIGLKEYFDLFFEEREKAIKAVKEPSLGNGKLSIAAWMKYMANVIGAGFGGLKTVSSQIANQERAAAKEDMISSNDQTSFAINGDLLTNADEYLSDIINHTYSRNTHLAKENLNLIGKLKGGANSGGDIAVTKIIARELTYNHGDKLNVGKVAEGMNLLRDLVVKEGSYKLGSREVAYQFFRAWGLEEFFEKFIEKKFVYSKKLRFITYKASEDSVTVLSGVFNEGEVLPIDEKLIVDAKTKDLYFITKEGFLELEKLIGGENFTFDKAENDDTVALLMKQNYKKNTGVSANIVNEGRYQEMADYRAIGESYDHLRENTYIGQQITSHKEKVSTAYNRFSEKARKASVWYSNIMGGEMKGKYPETEEGQREFLEDMYSVFSNSLQKFYKKEGIPEEEIPRRVSNMATILTAQAALESGYGTNPNSENYNYGNITATGRQRYVEGGDLDAEGKPITQKFRVFRSGEEYAQEKLKLLNRGHYKGSLMTNSPQEYFEFIQRGRNGDGGEGKYAEDPEYINKGVNAVNKIVPTINSYLETLEESTTQTQEPTDQQIKLDPKGRPYYITPSGEYKVYFDRTGIGNLKEGQTPWDVRSSVVKIDRATGTETEIDSNLPIYTDGANSLKEVVNRSVSSNQYPELNNPCFEFNFFNSTLLGTQKLSEFSNRAQKMIKLTYGNLGRPIPNEIPFYITPNKTAEVFLIETVSILTNTQGEGGVRRYTGTIYEGMKFPKEYFLELSEKTLEGRPEMRNPRFYSIKFEMGKRLRKKFEKYTEILKSDNIKVYNGVVHYSQVDENGTGYIKDLDKEQKKELLDLGLIDGESKLTKTGEFIFAQKNYHPLASEFESMSPEERKKYGDFMTSLTDDPVKKAEIRTLSTMANASLQAIHDVLGINTPHSLLPKRQSPTETSSAENSENKKPESAAPMVVWEGDKNTSTINNINYYQTAANGGDRVYE